MIPSWLRAIANLTPLLFFLSIGLVGFGVFKLFGYFAQRSEDAQEEDRQRQKLVSQLQEKIETSPSKKSPSGRR